MSNIRARATYQEYLSLHGLRGQNMVLVCLVGNKQKEVTLAEGTKSILNSCTTATI